MIGCAIGVIRKLWGDVMLSNVKWRQCYQKQHVLKCAIPIYDTKLFLLTKEGHVLFIPLWIHFML